MWHEARKQERKIRVMMVDYKRRADRRRQFYEQIKQDPAQFVRIYGRQCKIHWEPSVALAAEGPQTMMPWRGDENIIIDRFDVRSHLDHYVEPDPESNEMTEAEAEEERRCNYERYRILVQNDVAGVSEDLCLRQIYLDELYGSLSARKTEDKKKNAENKAAIGFTYEDSTPVNESKANVKAEQDDGDSDFEEVDLDNIIDIYNLSLDEIALLNQASLKYGMEGNDFYYNLEVDKDEAEALRLAKLMEEEKAQFSGRKSRRERRAFKERRLKDRPTSPPVYAARESPKYEPYDKGRSTSRSKSRSPEHTEEFSFITSFGGDGDEAGVVQGPTLPPHLLPKGVRTKSHSTRSKRSRDRSHSRDPDERFSSKASARISRLKGLRNRTSRSSSCSQSRSRSRSRHRSYSKSPLRRRGRYGRSRSRSASRSWHTRRRSRSWSRDRRSWSRGRRSWSRSRRSRSHGRRSRSRDRRSRSRGHHSRSCSYRSSSPGRLRSRRSRSYSRSRSNSVRSFSRSRSYSSRSPSSSMSRSRSYSRSVSKSLSRSPPKPIEPVIKSYRRPSLSSSSSSSLSDSESQLDDEKQQQNKNSRSDKSQQLGKKDSFLNKSNSKASLAEKMKLKMQKALKRQLKADMKARQEKEEKVQQQRQDREDELRAIAIQLRRREREKRHKEEAEVLRRSRSRSRSFGRSLSKSRHRTSRSRSPRHGRHDLVASSRESRHLEGSHRNREPSRGDWDDLRRRHASDNSRRTERDGRDAKSYRDMRDNRESRSSHTSHRTSDYHGNQTHSSSESPRCKQNMPKLVDY